MSKTEWWEEILKKIKEEVPFSIYDTKYNAYKNVLYIYTGNYSEEFDNNDFTLQSELYKRRLLYLYAKSEYPNLCIKQRNERYHGLELFGIQIERKAE